MWPASHQTVCRLHPAPMRWACSVFGRIRFCWPSGVLTGGEWHDARSQQQIVFLTRGETLTGAHCFIYFFIFLKILWKSRGFPITRILQTVSFMWLQHEFRSWWSNHDYKNKNFLHVLENQSSNSKHQIPHSSDRQKQGLKYWDLENINLNGIIMLMIPLPQTVLLWWL